jgi:hypothetical protein
MNVDGFFGKRADGVSVDRSLKFGASVAWNARRNPAIRRLRPTSKVLDKSLVIECIQPPELKRSCPLSLSSSDVALMWNDSAKLCVIMIIGGRR